MEVSRGFVEREVAGEYLLIPVGDKALEMKGLIALSESGHFLFQKMNKECTFEDLLEAMKSEYDAPEEIIRRDVCAFVQQMRTAGILKENDSE